MAVVKYRDENGNYVAVPTGIPNAVSAFENDAGYITDKNLEGLASETFVNESVSEAVGTIPTLDDYFIQGRLASVAQTGSFKDLNQVPEFATVEQVQEMINASLPASAEEVKY